MLLFSQTKPDFQKQEANKTLLPMLILLSTACTQPLLLESAHHESRNVINGSSEPYKVFALHELHKNAVVGQLIFENGGTYQGCSGSIVGDHLVVTAGHCIMPNFWDWVDGSDPITRDPDTLFYAAGDNLNEPYCKLAAAEVHLHPDMELKGSRLNHDMALIVLADSVSEKCPNLLPLMMNYEPLYSDLLEGRIFLQGGFGSLDDSYNFSPIRHWSLLDFNTLSRHHIVTRNREQGFPSNGDSGSALLHHFDDDSLRVIGLCSTGSIDRGMDFVRLDDSIEFIQGVADVNVMCGTVDEKGKCREQSVVTCNEYGYRIKRDCKAEGLNCIDKPEGAQCVCSCDTDEYCQKDCSCQPQCNCPCDSNEQCSSNCRCDLDCVGGCHSLGAPLDLFLFLVMYLVGCGFMRRIKTY